ncbi:hypothetical protein A5724_16035 [Mycobacterium sp. ACS1612]|uniref:hypothetical protein n=1 Tax=Mycobacterium sp. ACS1612 TaxID=1834117 RepID=UPI0007FDB59A|nr:hypothetical protein [Mycobacterium sp. ACS1612]OBF34885.1 hypothetical protein A5724_16035 [Mycobacterium sp. ACS1612]
MTDLIAPFDAEPVKRPADVEAPPRTPVLITEQQVLFATAAAVPLRPVKTRWIDSVRAVLLAVFAVSSNEKRPKRRHYPPRVDFLEDSRMAREMTRL